MRVRDLLCALLVCAGCIGREEALTLDDGLTIDMEPSPLPRYGGFRNTPAMASAPPPLDAERHYEAVAQPMGVARRRDWDLLQDFVDEYLGWDEDRHRCPMAPPLLPAISADRRVLALGVRGVERDTVVVAVHLIRTGDGKALGRYLLPRHENAAIGSAAEYCEPIAELARWLAPGAFESMPAYGLWLDGQIPQRVDPWKHVVSDAATREVDGATDIVVVPAGALGPEPLQVQRVPEDYGGDISAWVSDEVAVLTAYYIGC